MMNIGIDLTINRIHMSVPQLLERCGYRTIAITTGMDGYVLDKQFYDSLGFDEYYDIYSVIEHSGGDTSDKAVYSLASKALQGQRTDKPIFAYIDTTAAHGPYDTKMRPEEVVPEANSADPEANEYVRRLLLGEREFQTFVESWKQFTHEDDSPTLVVDFGDHQPSFTKYLPGRNGTVDLDRQRDDDLLITFFRLQSIGFDMPSLPDHPLVDVPFLGDWTLKAAGSWSNGVFAQRWQIVERCSSRYWKCAEGAEAHDLHQTLRAAGLITIR